MFPLRDCVTKMPNTTEMQAWMCCRNDVRVACQNRWFDHSPVPYETIRKRGCPSSSFEAPGQSRTSAHRFLFLDVFDSAKVNVSKTSVQDHEPKVSWSKRKGATRFDSTVMFLSPSMFPFGRPQTSSQFPAPHSWPFEELSVVESPFLKCYK